MPASEIMRKFKKGTLRSGSGGKVTDPEQAKAIAASYGEEEHKKKAKGKLPSKPKPSRKKAKHSKRNQLKALRRPEDPEELSR